MPSASIDIPAATCFFVEKPCDGAETPATRFSIRVVTAKAAMAAPINRNANTPCVTPNESNTVIGPSDVDS